MRSRNASSSFLEIQTKKQTYYLLNVRHTNSVKIVNWRRHWLDDAIIKEREREDVVWKWDKTAGVPFWKRPKDPVSHVSSLLLSVFHCWRLAVCRGNHFMREILRLCDTVSQEGSVRWLLPSLVWQQHFSRRQQHKSENETSSHEGKRTVEQLKSQKEIKCSTNNDVTSKRRWTFSKGSVYRYNNSRVPSFCQKIVGTRKRRTQHMTHTSSLFYSQTHRMSAWEMRCKYQNIWLDCLHVTHDIVSAIGTDSRFFSASILFIVRVRVTKKSRRMTGTRMHHKDWVRGFDLPKKD